MPQWQSERNIIREKVIQLLGDSAIPTHFMPVKLISSEKRNGYFLEKLEFDNGVGYKIPAYVLVPDQKKSKYPAILYMHYHWGEYGNGKEELFKNWPANEKIGEALVNRGYIVMAIDAYAFGERQGKGPDGENEKGKEEEYSQFKYFLWKGQNMWGMMLRDDKISLDYLCSRPDVDITRIGCTGMSMGSSRAWWLAAIDERIKSTVAVACLTRYQDLIDSRLLYAHSVYFFVPGMLKYFDTEAVLSLIPPRQFLNLVGDKDVTSPASGVYKIDSTMICIYKLYGKTENYKNKIYPGIGHAYTAEMYHEMLNWFDKTLNN